MAIDMSQFYQVFFDESAEHLAAMEGLLLDLDVENPDSEQLNAIFRAAHSIKGSAGTFGFTDLAETTHILENLLDPWPLTVHLAISAVYILTVWVGSWLVSGDNAPSQSETDTAKEAS